LSLSHKILMKYKESFDQLPKYYTILYTMLF